MLEEQSSRHSNAAPAGYLTEAKQRGCSHCYDGLSKISRTSVPPAACLDWSILETSGTIRVSSVKASLVFHFNAVQLETMQNIVFVLKHDETALPTMILLYFEQ